MPTKHGFGDLLEFVEKMLEVIENMLAIVVGFVGLISIESNSAEVITNLQERIDKDELKAVGLVR